MNPLIYKFQFGDGTNHDATVDEASAAIKLCENYKWNVTPNESGITGAQPSYTIEVSSDGSNWFAYDTDSTNVPTDEAVCDDHMTFTYIRVNHSGTGTTGGNVEYTLTLKRG